MAIDRTQVRHVARLARLELEVPEDPVREVGHGGKVGLPEGAEHADRWSRAVVEGVDHELGADVYVADAIVRPIQSTSRTLYGPNGLDPLNCAAPPVSG